MSWSRRRTSAGTSSLVLPLLRFSPAAAELLSCASLCCAMSLSSLPHQPHPPPPPLVVSKAAAPQAEQTVRGFPGQRLLCPHPSSCPGGGTGGGQLPHLPQAALSHHQHISPSCFTSSPQLQHKAGARGHWCSQCWATDCELHSHSPEQFCHTSECEVEGKGGKAKPKGMQTRLLQCWELPARITGTSGQEGEF